MGRPSGCDCKCGEDEECYFGVIDGGTMINVTSGNSPTNGFELGITDATLNTATHGPLGTGRIKVFVIGQVTTICAAVYMPTGTPWIDACVDFLTAGGSILLVGEHTSPACLGVADRTAINTFLSAVGSALRVSTGAISLNTGDQLITGPSATVKKVFQHPLTLNACRIGHGGAGQVLNGTAILQGTNGITTGNAISSEDLYLDPLNPEVFGRVVFICDANFFTSVVATRQNATFLNNMCGFTPCQVTRWSASFANYSSSGIYTSGLSTSTLTVANFKSTVNHVSSGSGKSAHAVALSSTSYRWDLNANGNGGIESFCIDFDLSMVNTSTYVDGGGLYVRPKISVCVLHASGYYTALDAPSFTLEPAPTASTAASSYSIGPITAADLALITGWPGAGAAPAIDASGAVGTRYVHFGLSFQFDDATTATKSVFDIGNISLKMDNNCA